MNCLQLLIDSDVPYAVASTLTRSRYTVINYCYAVDLKGIKNRTEIAGFKAAYLRDSAAFVRWVSGVATYSRASIAFVYVLVGKLPICLAGLA